MAFSEMDALDVPEVAQQVVPKSPEDNELFDVIVIGAGPAGMSAAVCASRAHLKTVVIEKAMPGGECSTACRIDNFVGQSGVFGPDLGRSMEDQLFSHDIYYTCETVVNFSYIDRSVKVITTSLGRSYRTKSIIFAIGLEPKTLDPSIEGRFLGQGVSYYAQADMGEYSDKNVVVIGGGNCACYAADYLSSLVHHVYMVHTYDSIRAVQRLRSSIERNPKISLVWNTKVTELFGIDHVERVKTENIVNGQTTWLDAQCVFVYIGRVPPQDIIQFDIELDARGFIITDDCMRTNIQGVYAAGDIRSKQVRQIATAVSDGMIAAINIERDIFR